MIRSKNYKLYSFNKYQENIQIQYGVGAIKSS